VYKADRAQSYDPGRTSCDLYVFSCHVVCCKL